MKRYLIAVALFCACLAHAQAPLQYRLTYAAAGDSSVQVRLDLAAPRPAPAILVMPRNYPGGYGLVLYDSFVDNVRAYSAKGEPLPVKPARLGPRWVLGSLGDEVARVEYSVDVVRMEKEVLAAVETSKVRPRYLGLLGYSVFAYVDGTEAKKISLQLEGPASWPVFSTLAPAVPAPLHTASATAPNYYALADSEVLMGPALQLRRLPGAMDLVMAVYSESDYDSALNDKLARTALDAVQRYFGDVPFTAYTAQLEFLKPLPGHDYNFSQEHLDSGTFSFSTDRAITSQSTPQQYDAELVNYAHHMAHSWIPKRAYGEGYIPFLWEMPPVIDTIWFNEGFGRYAGIAALAEILPAKDGAALRASQLDGLQGVLDAAPMFIRRMPTDVLSREASFMYSVDFRTGMNIFSRGALMASEMDARIRQQTQGKKDLRDALRALVAQTQANQRPFQVDELAPLFQRATGVDVSDILQRWLQAQDH